MQISDFPAAAAFLSVLHSAGDFKTRTPRDLYWQAAAVSLALIAVPLLIMLLFPAAGAILLAVTAALLAVPMAAATARRLHDVSRSAWWTLCILVPAAGLAVLIFWTVRRGDSGDNFYGADPAPIPHF